MARFDRAIATALRLIAKNGQKVVWRVLDDATADPATPWLPGQAAPANKDVMICFLPVDKQTLETFSFRKATEVPKGAYLGLMGNVPFDPNIKDIVMRDGKQLNIDSIDLLSPNGQKVLYTIIFKQ